MNLYIPRRKGYYIYAIKQDKFFAQYVALPGLRVSKVFYELQTAINWLDMN